MSTDERRDDLRAFHDFIGDKIANGGANLTPAEVLDLREVENPTDKEREATVQAVREALADMWAGDKGRLAGEVLRGVRSAWIASKDISGPASWARAVPIRVALLRGRAGRVGHSLPLGEGRGEGRLSQP